MYYMQGKVALASKVVMLYFSLTTTTTTTYTTNANTNATTSTTSSALAATTALYFNNIVLTIPSAIQYEQYSTNHYFLPYSNSS